MGEAAQRLLDEVMALAEDERELLSVELNVRLRAHDPQWEAAWTREIERRIEQVRAGTVALRSWDEVRAELRARRSGQ